MDQYYQNAIEEALKSNNMQEFRGILLSQRPKFISKEADYYHDKSILNLVMEYRNDDALRLLLDMGVSADNKGLCILSLAAEFASGETIKKLIETNPVQLKNGTWYISPMASAIVKSNVSAATVLLDEMTKEKKPKLPPQQILDLKYAFIRKCIREKEPDKLSQAISAFPEALHEEKDVSNSDNTSLLDVACTEKSEDALIQLIQAGQKFNNDSASLPLMYRAAEFAGYGAMKLVIGLGGDMNAQVGESKETALEISLQHNNFPAAIALLEHGAERSHRVDQYAQRLCFEAIKMPNNEVLKTLIDAYPHIIHKVGPAARTKSLILKACKVKNDAAIRILLNEGETFHIKPKKKHHHEKTPLQYAVTFASRDTIELFIHKGAVFKNMDTPKRSLVSYALRAKNLEVVTLLLKKGATINLKQLSVYNQAMGLDFIYKKDYEKLETLLSNNPGIFKHDRGGWQSNRNRFLYCAIQNKDEKALRILVEYGANVEENIEYILPCRLPFQATSDSIFLLIAPFASAKMIEYLISKGAIISAFTQIFTDAPYFPIEITSLPLYRALQNGNFDAAELLMKHDDRIKHLRDFGGKLGSTSLMERILSLNFPYEDKAGIISYIESQTSLKKIIHLNDGQFDGLANRFIHSFQSNHHIGSTIKWLHKMGANIEHNYGYNDIKSCNPAYYGNIPNTPLRHAFLTCNFEAFCALKELGATIDTAFLRRLAPSARLNGIDCHNFFAKYVASDFVNSLDYEALELAIFQRDREECNKLIRGGARIDYRDGNGNTLLHRVIKQNSSVSDMDAILDLILELGADINKQSNAGNSALHLAICFGTPKLVTFLLLRRAAVNIKNNKGNTPLHLAVLKNSIPKIDTLFQNGADVRIPNNKRRTPLVLAYSKHNPKEKAKKYLENLINDANHCDKRGQNKLHHLVVDNESLECVREWIKKGLDISKRDQFGYTPLHLAVLHQREKVAGELLKHNASCDAKDVCGATALHHAAILGNVKLVNLLMDHGSFINATDESGFTPLDYAIRGGDAEKCIAVEKILLERGGVYGNEEAIKDKLLEMQRANDEKYAPLRDQYAMDSMVCNFMNLNFYHSEVPHIKRSSTLDVINHLLGTHFNREDLENIKHIREEIIDSIKVKYAHIEDDLEKCHAFIKEATSSNGLNRFIVAQRIKYFEKKALSTHKTEVFKMPPIEPGKSPSQQELAYPRLR
ncbi:MAG: ankyrin repeat domain-containing protein [Alphaproteobacteria bacterium]|nr:ankyrin repeat domain-containing protein [Alphaproteobacteria bacterium]